MSDPSHAFPEPQNVRAFVLEQGSRYGRLQLHARENAFVLVADDDLLGEEVWRRDEIRPYAIARIDARSIAVQPALRGHLKQALVKLGWPVADFAGYAEGAPLAVSIRETTLASEPFALRPYQVEAARAFHDQGSARGGTGVVVLPCGAGKTLVGIAVIAARAHAHARRDDGDLGGAPVAERAPRQDEPLPG